MRHLLLVTFLCNFFFLQSFGQNPLTIYGKITDSETGEFLIGATIYCSELKIGITSNNYGFYSLKLPKGNHRLLISFIGYNSIEQEVLLTENKEINFSIRQKELILDEVVITANSNEIINLNKTSYHKLDLVKIKNVPSVAGVSDILKTIQLLPGIQTTNEGTVGFNVRGGSFDQNLILLDEAPLYNPSHALGFFSTINSEMIKDVSVYKGDFQAKYGGRVSSVVDIRLREGNNQQYKVQGEVGILASNLIIEGPIQKEKSSFIISGRYSYAGWMANLLDEVGDLFYIPSLNNFKSGNDVYFYDLNAKLNFNLNSKNRLFISGYNGLDYFYSSNIDDRSTLQWGNSTGTIRWSHQANSQVFMNTSLIYSNYNYKNNFENISFGQRWSSKIQNVNLKHDIDYYYSTDHHLSLGLAIEYFKINPGDLTILDTITESKGNSLPIENSIQATIYISDNWDINDKFNVNYGLRVSAYGVLGNGYAFTFNEDGTREDSTFFKSSEFEKMYYFLEPRLNIQYKVNPELSFKFSYTRANQSLHQLSNTSISLPTDMWVPVDINIKPVKSNSFSLGYYQKLSKIRNIDFSIEAYYKELDNIIDYIDNADLLMNENVSTQIKSGKANAYGIEFLLQKNSNKFNGWISYTYSSVKYNIEGINNDESYYPRHEKPHNLSVVLNYNLKPRLILNTVFKYNSGGYITVPEGTFYYNGATFNYYTERNGYELSAYHRLDIGIKYLTKRSQNRKYKSEWELGIYNVYGRKNTFSMYTKPTLEGVSFYKMYVFGVTPYITYKFKF